MTAQISDVATRYGLTRLWVYVFISGVLLWLALIGFIEYAASPINEVAIEREAMEKFSAVEQLQERSDYTSQRITLESTLRFLSLAFGYVVLPIILSYLFTRHNAEHYLIPPLFLQIIAYSFMIPYAVFRFLDANQVSFTLVLIGGLFAVLLGTYQDSAMIRLLGRTVNRRDLEVRIIKVQGTTASVLSQRLQEEPLRELLGLSARIRRDGDRIILSSRNDEDLMTYIELRDAEEGVVMMNLLFVQTGRYFTRWSRMLFEFAERTVGHLVYRLMTPDILVTQRTLDEQNPESLMTFAIRDLSGYLGQNQENTVSRRRLFLPLLVFVIPIVYFSMRYEDGITSELFGYLVGAISLYTTIIAIDATYSIRKQRQAEETWPAR